MPINKNLLRCLFLAVAFLAYPQPSSAWAYCGSYCSGQHRINECAYYEEPYSFDCQDIYWVQAMDDECYSWGLQVGSAPGWFSMPYCDDAMGQYSTYCSFLDPSCP